MSAAKVVPRPAAIRSRIATEGFACPSSIWVSMRRETSLRSASAPTLSSSSWRAARIRSPSCSTTAGRIPPLMPLLLVPARRPSAHADATKPGESDGHYLAHHRECALCCAEVRGRGGARTDPVLHRPPGAARAPPVLRRRSPMAGLAAPTPTSQAPTAPARGPLLRWFVSYGTFTVPQAAAPIAFSLIALPLTGDASSGAAMMLAMTIAQVIGAVPITRLGRRHAPVPFVRGLIGLRTLALIGIAVLAGLHAPFPLVVVGAAFAGLVNGAAFGTLRAVLNHLVPAGRLPRALGVAATLNEVAFVASPVLAAALGTLSPQAAVWAMVLLGMGPMFLLPRIPTATAPGPDRMRSRLRLTPSILLWLVCGAAGSASIAAIEIGAVSMAVSFGMPATWGVVFPIALCVTSILGGLWVSVRNRVPRRRTV